MNKRNFQEFVGPLLTSQLGLFTLTTLMVLFMWLVLGWNPELLIGNHDMILQVYPLNKLLEIHNYEKLNWTTAVFGGAYVYPVVGSLLVNKTLFFLGLSVGSIMNMVVMLIQAICGFFTFNIVSLFLPRANRGMQQLFILFFSVVFIAFSPIMAWRIEHGHVNFLWPMAFFIASSFCALSIFKKKKPDILSTSLLWLSGVESLSQYSHQLILYMIIPAFVVFIYLLKNPESRKDTLWPIMLSISILLFVFPAFLSMLTYALSGIGARNFGTNALYSYFVATFSDLDSLFFVNPRFLNSSRSSFLNHEVHYPLILPFMSFILFWKDLSPSFKKMAWPIVTVSLFIFILSLNPPYLGRFLEHIPLISSFRLIGRANILWGLAAYIFMLVILMRLSFTIKEVFFLLSGILLCLGFKNQNWMTEIFLWITFLFSFLSVYLVKDKKFESTLLRSFRVGSFLVIISSLTSILNIYINFPQIDREIEETKKFLKSNYFSRSDIIIYKGSLSRFLGTNATMPLDVGGIEGYWFPTAQFVKDFSSSLGTPPDSMLLNHSLMDDTHTERLSAIYPVKASIACHEGHCTATPLEIISSAIIKEPRQFLPHPWLEFISTLSSLILLSFLLFGAPKKWSLGKSLQD